MSTNLVAPKGGESAIPVHVMSAVVVFVMWAMVAAIPCQERSGLATTMELPKQVVWAQGMTGLVEKIGEEWKRKEKKGGAVLMEEIHKLEKLGHNLVELSNGYNYPGEAEKVEEEAMQVAEMGEVCRRMEEGLVPLQQQIREVLREKGEVEERLITELLRAVGDGFCDGTVKEETLAKLDSLLIEIGSVIGSDCYA